MRIYDSQKITKFIEHVRKDPTVRVEDIPKHSDWEVFRYSREEAPNSGSREYGIIYRNNKGRYTLVGLAVEDYRENL